MKPQLLRISDLSSASGTLRPSAVSLTQRVRGESTFEPLRADLCMQSQDRAVLPEERQEMRSKVYLWMEKYLPIQSPFNWPLILWNVLLALSLVYLLADIPATIFFGQTLFNAYASLPSFIPLYLTLAGIFAVNSVVTMSSGYFSDGLLFMGRGKVLRHYLSWHFVPDVLTVAALLMVAASRDYYVNIGKAVALVKWGQLYELDVAFKRVFQFMRLRKMLYYGARMVVIMFLCCNYIGPIFYFIDLRLIEAGTYGAQASTFLWVNNNSALPGSLLSYSLGIQYLQTMYWALNMISQICIGNIAPVNPYQAIYFFYLLMLSTIVYTYLINLVIEIVIWVRKRVKALFNRLVTLHQFMARRNIDPLLQAQVRACVEFLWDQQKDRDSALEAQVITELPEILKEDLKSETYHYFLLPFQALGLPPLLLKELAERIQQRRYSRGQFLYRQGQASDDHSLYYVVSGEAHLKFQNPAGQRFLLGTYGQKDIFGWSQFLKPGQRKLSICAHSQCLVFVLGRQDFEQACGLDPNLHHGQLLLEQKVNMGRKQVLINLKCAECASYDHQVDTCPVLHYNPRVLFPPSKRKPFERTRTRMPTLFKLAGMAQTPEEEPKEEGVAGLVERIEELLQELRARQGKEVQIERVFETQMFETDWNISRLSKLRL